MAKFFYPRREWANPYWLREVRARERQQHDARLAKEKRKRVVAARQARGPSP